MKNFRKSDFLFKGKVNNLIKRDNSYINYNFSCNNYININSLFSLLFFDLETSDNGELERQETLIGEVQSFVAPPSPTGFSFIGIKEPLYEERKRYYRNSSSVSQVSAVQAQTSASCFRTPSGFPDRILRRCDRFKNRPNRVPVCKSVIRGLKSEAPTSSGYGIRASILTRHDARTTLIELIINPMMMLQSNEKYSESAKFEFEAFGVNCCEKYIQNILDLDTVGLKSGKKNCVCACNLSVISALCENNTLFVVLNVVGSSPTGHPRDKPP